MRVLITGVNGFSGRYLADYALQSGETVYGLSRHALVSPSIIGIACDLMSPEAVSQAVQASQPDYVFHLAAQTPANARATTEHDWLQANPIGTLNLLEAIRIHCPQAHVLIMSSSAIYGHVPVDELPIREDMPIRPTTMYGVSKAVQELLAIRYLSECGIHVVRARPFNLIGPGERPGMVTSTLAAQIVRIAAGHAQPIIRIRHSATQRDFTDIRDAVRAYWSIIEKGRSGDVYNVCSGIATPIGSLVDQMMTIAHISARIEETAPQPTAGDILAQTGSYEKLYRTTGWQPQIDLRRSLTDLLGSYTM